jgi:hypothetical protein
MLGIRAGAADITVVGQTPAAISDKPSSMGRPTSPINSMSLRTRREADVMLNTRPFPTPAADLISDSKPAQSMKDTLLMST